MENGFDHYYPLKIGAVKSGHHAEIVKIGTMAQGAKWSLKLAVNSKVYETLNELYKYFTGEMKTEVSDYLASPGSGKGIYKVVMN